MFSLIRYDESMKAGWDELALARGSVFHTTAFRQVLLDSFGYRCGYHAAVDGDGRIRAIVPLITGRSLSLRKVGVALPFVNHADLCADSEEALQYVRGQVAGLRDRLRLSSIELRLKDQTAPDGAWSEDTHNVTFLLPLLGSEEDMLALSSGSNRNHVRKVYKNDWFDVSFDPAHLESFYRVYVRRMKQLGSPAPDIVFFRKFFEHLPEQATLLTVLDKENGAVVGGMLLLVSRGDGVLYYPFGANLPEYNNKYLNNFMYWEAVRFGMRQGMKALDLGRSPQGSGTFRYKQQWGAKPETLHYARFGASGGASADPERLSGAIELWKRLPAAITDRVGKAIIPYVMP